jgi:hypothetical protein
MDRTIEPKKAGIKPRISNPEPGVMELANHRVKALITNVNKPKVMKVIGNAKICKIGRIMAFTKPMTIAAIKAAVKPLRMIPGTILAVINNATAVPSQVKRKCFIFL